MTWLKKAAGYLWAFLAGAGALLAAVFLAMLGKADPGPKCDAELERIRKEEADEMAKRAAEIRGADPGRVADSLPDGSRSRIEDIKRAAVEAAVKRASDRRRHAELDGD